MVINDTIYYLTGRGGELDKGLGKALLDRGFNIKGREMSGTFDTLAIQDQIDAITQDLQADFWHKDAKVIAVSYGAYLLLQTLSELEPYQGSILLLSPVTGSVTESMRYFSPPRPNKLIEMMEGKSFPKPNAIEIHLGDDDWQSPYRRAVQFAAAMDGVCTVVPDTGHNLDKSYVADILDRWC